MYFQLQGNYLAVLQSPDAPPVLIPLSEFDELYGIAWHPLSQRVLLTAVRRGEMVKRGREAYRARVYWWSMARNQWEKLSDEYAYSAIPMPDSSAIVLDTGRGVALLDADGRTVFDYQYERIHMSPREVLPAPDGSRIAFMRCKSDRNKCVIFDVAERTATEHAPSWYYYCWYSTDCLLLATSHTLKQLVLASGKTKTFFTCQADSPALQQAVANTPAAEMYEPQGRVEFVTLDHLRCHDNRFYFSMRISGAGKQEVGKKRTLLTYVTFTNLPWSHKATSKSTVDLTVCYDGIYSLNADGNDLRLEYLAQKEWNIDEYVLDADGAFGVLEAYRRDCCLVETRWAIQAPPEHPMHEGWIPMSDGRRGNTERIYDWVLHRTEPFDNQRSV